MAIVKEVFELLPVIQEFTQEEVFFVHLRFLGDGLQATRPGNIVQGQQKDIWIVFC